MTEQMRIEKLQCPKGRVDVVLDTDTYNEVDDQYALSLLLKSDEKLRVQGIFAAPFFNENSTSPADGMERSYDEILKLLHLMQMDDKKDMVFRGSSSYMENETTPVQSPAASRLCELAMAHTPENPLYVVAIGAITNVASAIVMQPQIVERMVLVWLGGHALEWPDNREFNLIQDVAAARVVFGCGVPLVQLPCMGVVSSFYATQYELEHWLKGKNALCDYLVAHTIEAAERYAAGKVWSRVIWDVTAVAWLLNDDDRFMSGRLEYSPIPEYDGFYSMPKDRHFIRYIYSINRDALMNELFAKLAQ